MQFCTKLPFTVLTTEMMSPITAGAGSVPTASAVIGDIISVVNTVKGSFVQNCMCYKDLPFFPDADMVSRFYLRLRVSDEPGVLPEQRADLGEHARLVAHAQPQVEPRHHVGVGEKGQILVAHAVLHEAALH